MHLRQHKIYYKPKLCVRVEPLSPWKENSTQIKPLEGVEIYINGTTEEIEKPSPCCWALHFEDHRFLQKYKGFVEQYSTTIVDPSSENLCASVPARKIVMS